MAAIDLKKDVIYIDIEDDITSVIGKVKDATAPIIALVPPKRIGVLQSVVNLKLLKRAAETAKKRVVLITNDQALTGLAAGIGIPVAKNLQSKPEIPSIAAASIDDDDVINGEELPVGELEKTSDSSVLNQESAAFGAAAISDTPLAVKAASRAPKKSSAVPDFDKFRKKLFIFGGLGALLLVFLVWAIFFAARASVAITANTNIVNITKDLQLRPSATLDTAQGVAPAVTKEIKRTSSVDFTATGKKDVGEKATGNVKFSRQSLSSTTVAAGTALTASGGLVFTTNQAVTIPASTTGPGCFPTACPGTVSVAVSAAERGTKYNAASGTLSGAPDSSSASFTAPTSGGTDKTITVVSQADIDKAKEQLQTQDSSKIKTELEKQFTDNAVVIKESYAVEPADPTSAPALDQEATAAKLTSETTYRLVGVARKDLKAIYDAYTKTQIDGEKNQKIYESGDKTTTFSQFTKNETGFTVRAQATGQVGPNIDEKALATQLKGKRAGEIQQQIEAIQGVEDVSVKFSPFWVTKAPNNADKITIKFVVKNGNN